MPDYYQTGHWRSNRETVSYDLAQVNHYATRYRESFLVKQARGRAFGGFELDLDYWQKMHRNEQQDFTIKSKLPNARAIYQELLADEKLKALHMSACEWYVDEIQRLRAEPGSAALLSKLVERGESAGT